MKIATKPTKDRRADQGSQAFGPYPIISPQLVVYWLLSYVRNGVPKLGVRKLRF